MTGNKGKHNFWSQILLGMLAIFLLPAHALENAATVPNGNYQNQSYSPRQQSVQVALQQEKTQQDQQHDNIIEVQQFTRIEPHFILSSLNPSAPIRAGPLFG